MRRSVLSLLCLAACAAPPLLASGTWTGTLAPMNHPDRTSPVSFEIVTTSGATSVALIRPEGDPRMEGREVRTSADSLWFTFDEPEAGVPLRCAWSLQNDGDLAGRCTAPDGKWAQFEISPEASR